MQLHVGRAIPNLYMAEHDPCTNDVIIADGYKISEGACSVPSSPGFGLGLDNAQFESHAKVRFDIKV
jgi:hypothetical protein